MIEETTIEGPTMKEEVLHGLRKEQKQLPSKFLYDEKGSGLFDQITDLQEYYPTRTEMAILRKNLPEIGKLIGQKTMLIELGSGSSKKIRLLLKGVNDLAAYVPVDISAEYLKKAAEKLHRDFPELLIKPVCADYTQRFKLPDLQVNYNKQVIFYPGSTIGNFHPEEARKFLKTMASLMDQQAAMLVGVDLKKDRETLESAYNDSKGITAAFNKNILERLNRDLDADFQVNQFTHHAFYNEEKGRIEMHLISDSNQEVQVAGQTFHFEKGESIHTENSYKYSVKDFRSLVSDWFLVENVWTDKRNRFSLQYLKKQ